jgi:uncharacterized glyoxalase superfamily protein PhnB
VPDGFEDRARGVVLAFRVTDAHAEEARLREGGATIVTPMRDEPWGQRHFIAADPDGVLIDVVQTIPPPPEWMDAHGLAQ